MFVIVPLAAKEELKFSIRYMGLPTAEAKYVISEKSDTNYVDVTVSSLSLINVIYYLNNQYKAKCDSLYRPYSYQKKVKQKKYFEDEIVYYNRSENIGTKKSYLQNTQTDYEITPDIRDFFSTLLYLRKNFPVNEDSLYLDGNGRIWLTKFKVVGEERIQAASRKFDCKILEFRFFLKSDKNKVRSDMITNNLFREENVLYFWFSKDKNHVPVKAVFERKPFPVKWVLTEYEKR